MLCCSFCGKSSEEVDHTIAGPDVYICNECVDLCVEIIREEKMKQKNRRMDFETEMHLSELMG